MKRITGISLIELLITTAIGAMLMGVALPSFNAVVDRQRAAAAHNMLLGTLQHARAVAVTERRQTVVCPSSNGTSCSAGGEWEGGWISFVDRNGNGQLDPADTVTRHESSGVKGLRVRSGAARPSVRFHANGRSAGSNLTIRLCNSGGRPMQGIVINNGGRARHATPAEVAAHQACM